MSWTGVGHAHIVASKGAFDDGPDSFSTAMLMSIAAVSLVSCGSKSIEGTYNATNTPMHGIVVTFGKNSFSFSSGASGNYEVSGDKVILTGMSVTGTYTIKGNTLVGDQFTFVPRDPNDKSPVNLGPRGMSNAQGNGK